MCNKQNKQKNQRGVSLIITFFILTIILAVVLSVSILLYSQVKIIRNIGNSVVAFYAADSGIEKVLYYDRRQRPASGKRGLCNIENTCPRPPPCEPGQDCWSAFQCLGVSQTPTDIENEGCDVDVCNNCEVSFYSRLSAAGEPEKTYNITAKVSPEDAVGGYFSKLEINSNGSYGGVKREINILTKESSAPDLIPTSLNFIVLNLDNNPKNKEYLSEGCFNDAGEVEGPPGNYYVAVRDRTKPNGTTQEGDKMHFHATINGLEVQDRAGKTIGFFDEREELFMGTGTTGSDGTAKVLNFHFSPDLADGLHRLKATYDGNNKYFGSDSNIIEICVVPD